MRVVFFVKQKTAYDIMPSLVGSEMCIRDRPWPCGRAEHVDAEGARGSRALVVVRRTVPDHDVLTGLSLIHI
ncbi:hypothetical protein BN3590_03100 [Clostridium sp. C105KSO15]|nr:hypothetical protein BN3590_03100 [Clostridium sp. C105KSO15]